MKYLLKHTNNYNEVSFFCNLGQQWPHDPSKRLIERTSSRAVDARTFDTAEEAREIIVSAGGPDGWSVEEVV